MRNLDPLSSNEALVTFLDAWDALAQSSCLGSPEGRIVALLAAQAPNQTPDLYHRVLHALDALGFPNAGTGPRALGTALRSLRARKTVDGRSLEQARTRFGWAWYVLMGGRRPGDMAFTRTVSLGPTAPDGEGHACV